MQELPFIYAPRGYENEDFLKSEEARNIRILCESTETGERLKRHGVSATVLFFGSARAKSAAQYKHQMEEIVKQLKEAEASGNADTMAACKAKKSNLEKQQWMCEYYETITALSHRVTAWSMTKNASVISTQVGISRYRGAGKSSTHLPDYETSEDTGDKESNNKKHKTDIACGQSFVVCTGGGPGFMEAANYGASTVPHGMSIGMAITLPFEAGLNSYVTQELAFRYHYFFTRKLWMVFHCQALVVAPGGVGTMDELFEVMTLRQTGKVNTDLPIVLIGKTFWSTVVNWQALADFGVVSQHDVDSLFMTDSGDEAFDYIITRLSQKKD